MKIIPYDKSMQTLWDEFIKTSKNGNIFHTRRFLQYHRNKFTDRSIIFIKKNKIIGAFPAVEWNNTIVSHKGSTYGGLIVGKQNRLSDALEMFAKLTDFYQAPIEFRKCEYIFDTFPSQEVEFAAKKIGFKLLFEELSTCLDLNHIRLTKGRKWALNKCKNLNIKIDDFNYDSFYTLLQNNLHKHNTTPTHTLEEMLFLKKLFPKEYILCSIYLNDTMIAGIWVVLATPITAHTFYIAQDYSYTEYQPLTCLIKAIIDYLKKRKYKYLNFGISTENYGEIINKGLFEFKESFGGFGVSRYYYRKAI